MLSVNLGQKTPNYYMYIISIKWRIVTSIKISPNIKVRMYM